MKYFRNDLLIPKHYTILINVYKICHFLVEADISHQLQIHQQYARIDMTRLLRQAKPTIIDTTNRIFDTMKENFLIREIKQFIK